MRSYIVCGETLTKKAQYLDVLNYIKLSKGTANLSNERKYIRARAYLEKKNYDDIFSLLKNDDSKEAKALKSEVFWREKKWSEAALGFKSLLDDRWKKEIDLDLDERNQVMQMTVSYALLDDWEALLEIRKKWLNLMSNSIDAEPFDILTTNSDTVSLDYRKVASRIAQINTLDAFMDRYRKNR